MTKMAHLYEVTIMFNACESACESGKRMCVAEYGATFGWADSRLFFGDELRSTF